MSHNSPQVVREVFRRLLCEEGSVAFDSLGPKGFWCLWQYFTVVNTQTRALSWSTVHKVKHICSLVLCTVHVAFKN